MPPPAPPPIGLTSLVRSNAHLCDEREKRRVVTDGKATVALVLATVAVLISVASWVVR